MMKKILTIILIAVLCVYAGTLWAGDTYTVLTPDSTITDISLVKVQITSDAESAVTVRTLKAIKTERGVLLAEVQRLQARIAALDIEYKFVFAEVGKVKLIK